MKLERAVANFDVSRNLRFNGILCVANNGCSAKSSRTARRKSLLNHLK